MKSRIFVMALALIFVAGFAFAAPVGKMNDKDNGNNYWGKVYIPTDVNACSTDDDAVLVCWDEGVPADDYWNQAPSKFSVVVMFTLGLDLNATCCDKLEEGCSCPEGGLVEMELDFGTLDEDYSEFVEEVDDGVWCMAILEDWIIEQTDAYLDEQCYAACILDRGPPPSYFVKVKGLYPAKGKRMNNKFSTTVEVEDCVE